MNGRAAATLLILQAIAIAGPRVGWGGGSLQVPVDPRGIAMGGAFCAIADDATGPLLGIPLA